MAQRRNGAQRSLWRGVISFGLVNIPIRLYVAVRENDIRFHLLHDQDKSRLQRRMICPVEGKEVPSEHIIRGYEISPGRHVVIEDQELEAIAPKASRAIEILHFVNIAEIDPLYFQHPYYVLPEEGAEKSYRLFTQALERTGKVGIARFVMRSKAYLATLRPSKDLLLLETMYFPDEIVSADRFERPGGSRVGERELKTAEQLINSLSARFEPKELHDEYRAAVLRLVERKAEGEEIAIQPEAAPQATQVSDILAALEASLAEARKKKGRPAPARRESPARREKAGRH